MENKHLSSTDQFRRSRSQHTSPPIAETSLEGLSSNATIEVDLPFLKQLSLEHDSVTYLTDRLRVANHMVLLTSMWQGDDGAVCDLVLRGDGFQVRVIDPVDSHRYSLEPVSAERLGEAKIASRWLMQRIAQVAESFQKREVVSVEELSRLEKHDDSIIDRVKELEQSGRILAASHVWETAPGIQLQLVLSKYGFHLMTTVYGTDEAGLPIRGHNVQAVSQYDLDRGLITLAEIEKFLSEESSAVIE